MRGKADDDDDDEEDCDEDCDDDAILFEVCEQAPESCIREVFKTYDVAVSSDQFMACTTPLRPRSNCFELLSKSVRATGMLGRNGSGHDTAATSPSCALTLATLWWATDGDWALADLGAVAVDLIAHIIVSNAHGASSAVRFSLLCSLRAA
eukprot:2723891-Amphidinium_carterae.1